MAYDRRCIVSRVLGYPVKPLTQPMARAIAVDRVFICCVLLFHRFVDDQHHRLE